MTEVAKAYLGNINHDSDLAEMVQTKSYWEITLSAEDRHKGRIHGHTDSGIAIGIIKSRDRSLDSGDLFTTDTNQLILIHLQEQELLVLDFSTVDRHLAPVKLVYLGHTLGNHHYPIAIEDNKILVQLITDKLIIEKLIHNSNIPGLQISYQTVSRNRALAEFENAIAFSQHRH